MSLTNRVSRTHFAKLSPSILSFLLQGREKDTKVSIYKKSEENYMLKLKASRALLAEVKTKYGNMPFNIRSFEEETKARMGVVECVSHKMIEPFQVLYEKPSKFYAAP